MPQSLAFLFVAALTAPPAADRPVINGIAGHTAQMTVVKLVRELPAKTIERATAIYVLDGGQLQVGYDLGVANAWPGDAIFLPPGTRLTAHAERPTRLLWIASSDTAARQSAAVVVHANDPRRQPIPVLGGQGERSFLSDGVADFPFSLGRMCFKAGNETPRHEHAADELVYVLSGRATTILDQRTVELTAGQSVSLPRGQFHALKVERDLCVVQVYTPGGPEQRFRPPPAAAASQPRPATTPAAGSTTTPAH